LINPAAEISLVRALFHSGRLADDFFAFEALHDFELVPGFEGGQISLFPQSALLCELGQVNVAERFAHEALSCDGDRPATLKLFARINVLKEMG
jgi:hypothetical protein